MIALHIQAESLSLLGVPELPHLSCGTWPCLPHSPQVQHDGEPIDVISLFLQYEVQGLPHSGLGDAVLLIEMCLHFSTLLDRLLYGLHSFLRHRRPPRMFLVTNIPSLLELVDQTSSGCSRWGFSMVMSTKQFLYLSKGQSIESPTYDAYSLFCGQHLSDYHQ